MTHPQDLNLPLDFGHSERRIDAPSANELDGDLFAPLTVQAQFDFSKLALAECLQEEVRAEFGDRAARMGSRVGYGGGVGVDVAIG